MRLLIFSFLIIFCFTIQAQPILSQSKKAVKLFEQGQKLLKERQVNPAIEKFNLAIDKDSLFAEAYWQAGAAYLLVNERDLALPYYAELAKRYPNASRYVGAHLIIAESEFGQGNYKSAKVEADKFLSSKNEQDTYYEKAQRISSNSEYALQRIANPLNFNPRPLPSPLNEYQQQYFPVLTADLRTLYFIKRTSDEEIYTSNKLANDSWSVPKPIDAALSSEYNEGTCTISADGRLMVFTSCMRNDGFGSCDLYFTRKTGNTWSEPKNIGRPVNSSAWDSQPALSADGRTLYYVSDRKGGLGKRDIWVTVFNDEAGWSNPKNLGPIINTADDDISPFIHVNDQSLFFASNGRTGFGGFDIYYSSLDSTGTWQEPNNFGYPINTYQDELAMFITADGKNGYYSHESSVNGVLNSKLYVIDIPEEIKIKYKSSYIQGTIIDSLTSQPIGANISLINLTLNKEISLLHADEVTGEYLIVLTEGADYALYVNADGYLFKSFSFSIDSIELGAQKLVRNIALLPIRRGESTTLSNVYFDFDSSRLTEKSKKALLYVADFLLMHDGLIVEISGHTDNTGSEAYNQSLSRARAESVYLFLVHSGVPEHRLSFIGYGSSMPQGDNGTAEGRSKNRRIEMKILK